MVSYIIELCFQYGIGYRKADDKSGSSEESLSNFNLTEYLGSLNPDVIANKLSSDLYSIEENTPIWISYQRLSFVINVENNIDLSIDDIKNILYDKYYDDENFWTITSINRDNTKYVLDYRNEFTKIYLLE